MTELRIYHSVTDQIVSGVEWALDYNERRLYETSTVVAYPTTGAAWRVISYIQHTLNAGQELTLMQVRRADMFEHIVLEEISLLRIISWLDVAILYDREAVDGMVEQFNYLVDRYNQLRQTAAQLGLTQIQFRNFDKEESDAQ